MSKNGLKVEKTSWSWRYGFFVLYFFLGFLPEYQLRGCLDKNAALFLRLNFKISSKNMPVSAPSESFRWEHRGEVNPISTNLLLLPTSSPHWRVSALPTTWEVIYSSTIPHNWSWDNPSKFEAPGLRVWSFSAVIRGMATSFFSLQQAKQRILCKL